MSLQDGPKIILPEDRNGTGPLRLMMRYNPGGLVHLEPDGVYTPTQATPYTVLPANAGILQLLAEGGLIYQKEGTYLIAKPFPRFPAGLHGVHANFILGKGLPMPGGSPGSSSVISEETGECLTVEICR